jgi:hypothetical protein
MILFLMILYPRQRDYMNSSTLQFITQVKLGELRKQRTRLIEGYDRLLRESASRPPEEHLGHLYRGLREIRCAGIQLHPDIVNLEILLSNTAPTPEVLGLWIRRLEGEVAAGRLRAEIAYLFGAILGEWGHSSDESARFHEERQKAHEHLLNQATRGAEPNRHGPLFQELFAGFGPGLAELQQKMPALIHPDTDPEPYLVEGFLLVVQRNIYQPAHLRKEAKRFAEDVVLQKELGDALQMHLPEPTAWDWPTAGVAARTLWTRNKWRLYLTLDLPALGLLHISADHWQSVFDQAFGDIAKRMNRKGRLKKLLELNAPDLIIDTERRMLREQEAQLDLGWYEPRDPWDDSLPENAEPGSLCAKRVLMQAALRASGSHRDYQGEGGSGGTTPGVGLVQAEVQTLRAAFPERPLFVAKLDIQDFFPSIPHDVILTLLGGCGVRGADLSFFERFLQVPFRIGETMVKAQRGVPMDQELSHFLAELLMLFLERYVHSRARVRIVRVIDDVTLLAPSAAALLDGWRALHDFIEACGLQINVAKSGAVALGGELPAELSSQPLPFWGMLELRGDGSWAVHEPTFQTHLEETRQRILATQAILARVNLYNAHLRFLTGALGLSLDLGDAHRASINDALRQFHREFFAPGIGIVQGLQQTIRERYLQDSRLTELPESWLYWPITAGGTSLRNPLVLVGQYNEAFAERQRKRLQAPSVRPENWQLGNEEWAKYYQDLLATIAPVPPKDTAVMKTLVQDFISRGAEISGGKQSTLSDYWRWILCVYGPEILEKFGTFRFLITELMPLQLIHDQLLHDSSLDESEEGK